MEIYLDNAATTKPCREAVSAVMECMEENYGNPSSLHKKGLEAQLTVDGVRKIIAKSIAADPSCIYFTSGATESNNIAVIGAAEIYGKRKPRIVTTSIEHASVKKAMEYLEGKGFEIVRISPDRSGNITHEAIVNAVDEKTCLVSIMMVNNETGYILPVRRAFYGIKKKYPECITHCDAVQGFMKIPFKAAELNADMISMSGHKIHAGKGVGALYLKKGVRTESRIFGGGQEKGVRSGTENVPMIAGMGAAVKKFSRDINERYSEMKRINNMLRQRFGETDGIVINSGEECSPYILNISVPGIRSEIMLHYLEEYGIYVSSGSACSKGAKSGVLSEFGLNDRLSDSALRISLCGENTVSELRTLAETIEYAKGRLIKSK
ncbi:cysteine desulfurase family protein [Porcipelethomonas sp.]|uniref:cysteine desulfurase family protein n=1 Tax=Porcipelethomonas sp. TaxID=2981675 RepID=UPI003EF42089